MAWTDKLGGSNASGIAPTVTRVRRRCSRQQRPWPSRPARRSACARSSGTAASCPTRCTATTRRGATSAASSSPSPSTGSIAAPPAPSWRSGTWSALPAARARAHGRRSLRAGTRSVLNVDALEYRPDTPFTSILTISTLEHVGFDEDDQDPDKTRRLIDHLVTLLAPGGELLVTFPPRLQPPPSISTCSRPPRLRPVRRHQAPDDVRRVGRRHRSTRCRASATASRSTARTRSGSAASAPLPERPAMPDDRPQPEVGPRIATSTSWS